MTWKRYLSLAPKGNRKWPHVPEAETKMVTIQITDYIMNAIGQWSPFETAKEIDNFILKEVAGGQEALTVFLTGF